MEWPKKKLSDFANATDIDFPKNLEVSNPDESQQAKNIKKIADNAEELNRLMCDLAQKVDSLADSLRDEREMRQAADRRNERTARTAITIAPSRPYNRSPFVASRKEVI